MSFDEKSPAFRRQSIFLFFKMHYEVYRAVEELKKAFHDITFEEVDTWFARFRTGSRDLATDVVIDKNARGMESVPVNLKRKIMESVNVDDQKALLKTNQCFRGILKADRRIYEKVEMHLGQDYLSLLLKNETTGAEEIRFKKREEGCEKKTKGKEATVLSGSYIEEGIKRFKKAIEKQGSKIKCLRIFNGFSEDKKDLKVLCTIVSKTFGKLKEKLHVEELSIGLFKKEDLYPVIDGIKVGPLTDLTLIVLGNKLRYNFNDCRSLEGHFAHLERLCTHGINFDFPLEALAGIRSISVGDQQLEPEAVKRYRDKIMESTSFNSHSFIGTFDVEEIRTALEPFQVADEFETYDGTLTAPGRKPIMFTLNECFIKFERKRK